MKSGGFCLRSFSCSLLAGDASLGARKKIVARVGSGTLG